MTTLSVTLTPAIETLLIQFWSIEDPSMPINHATENKLCKEWFSKTAFRNKVGRFRMSLPFRKEVFAQINVSQFNTATKAVQINEPLVAIHSFSYRLGISYSMILKLQFNLEHKLIKDAKLCDAYRDFMAEYFLLGHMKVTTQP